MSNTNSKDTNFSENQIRPDRFENGNLRARDEDIKRLKTNIDKFIDVNCPACGSKNNNFEFTKFDFNFVKCQKCNTVFMNPRPTKEILNEFYTNSVAYTFWNKYIFPSSRKVRMEKIFRPRLKKIINICETFKINRDLIIEVGSASGMFTEECRRDNTFKRIVGIEPSKSQAETCKEKGIEVIQSTIEKVGELNQKANVLVSFETIEHVFSPDLFMQCCRKLMADKGLIVLTCPNYAGFDIEMMGIESDSLDHEHINLFNPKSIEILFKRNNFEIIEISTPGKLDLDIFRNYLLKKNSYSLDNFLRKIIFDEWELLGSSFQDFLSSNKLSSHMWAVGRKINQ